MQDTGGQNGDRLTSSPSTHPAIGSTSATVSTPGTAQTIYWIKEGMLDHPDTYQGTDYVGASTRFWESTKAFSFQMVIDYVFISEGEWKEESIEVPIAANSSFSYVVYPSVYKVQVYAGGVYYKDPYMKALARVAKLHAGTKLIFNRIVFRFLQVDQNWYDYYNTVRNFRTRFRSGLTIRISPISAMGTDCLAPVRLIRSTPLSGRFLV